LDALLLLAGEAEAGPGLLDRRDLEVDRAAGWSSSRRIEVDDDYAP
jgi:hypothetical protein